MKLFFAVIFLLALPLHGGQIVLAQSPGLNSVISVQLSDSIDNVGQALERVLSTVGYTLNVDPQSRDIYAKRLNNKQQKLQGISPQAYMRNVLGRAWSFDVDAANRSVTIYKGNRQSPASRQVVRRRPASFSSARIEPEGSSSTPREASDGLLIREGILSQQLDSMIQLWGWKLIGWEDSIRYEGKVLDWQIKSPYRVYASTLQESLELVLGPYPILAKMNTQDRTVQLKLNLNELAKNLD